jgi:hypothetical protein
MISFPEPTAQEIQDSKKHISIREAQGRSPKGGSHICTYVAWGRYNPEFITPSAPVDFIALAVPPKLPNGYHMTFHDSWEEWSIAVNDKMVELCKTGDLRAIYDFDCAVDAFIKEAKETLGINLYGYWDCSFEGHEEPSYPEGYYAFSDCQDTNRLLNAMSGNDIYSQLKTMRSGHGHSNAWVNTLDIAAITKDGQTVSLKDSTLPLDQIASVYIGVKSQLEFTDPYFQED